MATVKLVLNKNRALKDGSFPLVFRIIHKRRALSIYTSYRLTPLEYDASAESVVYCSDEYHTQKDIISINQFIKKQRLSIDFHIKELELLGDGYNVEQIVSRYHIEHDRLSLLGYIDQLILEKRKIGKIGTSKAYSSTRSSLSKFIDCARVSLSSVDAVFVKKYEHFLIQTGVKPNTICYYVRNFKSIYSQAVCDGFEAPRLSPFRSVSSRPQKTAKRALDLATLRRIKKLRLVGERKKYALARDMFMFSFFTRGMPFVDIIYLKKDSINNNVISYCRRKTGQWLHVALTEESKMITSRHHTDGDYVFPHFNEVGIEDLHKLYCKHLEKTNRELGQIAKILKLKVPLTTYVARHCWATTAKTFGFSTSLISESLGHSSEKITQIYLKEFDQSVLDNVNEEIVSSLSK